MNVILANTKGEIKMAVKKKKAGVCKGTKKGK